MKELYFSILVFVSTFSVVAQTDTTSTSIQGEIISGQVVIEKDKKITLPKADKIFLRTEPQSFENQPIDVRFSVQNPNFEWPAYKSDVPFKKLNETYPTEGFQNYIKLGYGNFNAPLFEAGIFQPIGSLETQMKLFYESFDSGPVNDENSGNTRAGVNLKATYKTESLSIEPSFSYLNRKYFFYGNSNRLNNGFNSDLPDEVSLSDWNTALNFSGGNATIKYKVKPGVTRTTQNLVEGNNLNEETVGSILGDFSYQINETLSSGLGLEYYKSTYDGGISYDRSLTNINPQIVYKKDHFTLKTGVVIASSSVSDNTTTGIYPDLRFDYHLTEKWTIYGVLGGGQHWNGLSTILNQNQFLDDSLTISVIENLLKVGGGLKGSIFKNMLFEGSLVHTTTEGLPFYVPSGSDSARYSLTYDTDHVGVLTLQSNLSYMPTATSTYGLNLEMNGYSLEFLDRPWHKPTYLFKAYTSHNFQESLILSGYLTAMGGIRGPANVDFGYVRLSAFTDVGFGIKYLFNSQASAFIDVNNLLNNEYERYLGYPTRGLAFKIGGQYRF